MSAEQETPSQENRDLDAFDLWDMSYRKCPTEVRIDSGGIVTVVDAFGTRSKKSRTPDPGARIEIDFTTDSGDSFTMVFDYRDDETELELRRKA